MMRLHDEDALEQALASLPVHEPARKCRARIRARAHQKLQRPSFDARLAAGAGGGGISRAIESSLVTAAAAFYLLAVLRLAIHLGRF